jgi:hypothetical protein
MRTKIALKRSQIEQAMELAGIDLEQLRTDYSGRGMYGETCMAITMDSLSDLAQFLVELTGMLVADTIGDEYPDVDEVIDPARELTHKLHTDSMGRSLVAYWPTATLED